mgnify:CR=1 FL=1|tara:strand:+ start:2556 stop:4169 length:1614 start_codon:yes stop_codon:yes gene_type:complete
MFRTERECREFFSRMKTDRSSWESRYQAISDYQLARSDFQGERQIKSPSDSLIYDGTAMDSWFMLTNAIQAILINTETNWIYFDTLTDDELTDDEVLWFDLARNNLQNIYRSDGSRFPTQINECLGDLTAYGYCAMHSGYDPSQHSLFFSARPIPEIFIDQDPKGMVSKIVRRFSLKNEYAEKIYGNKCPDIILKANKAGKAHEDMFWLTTYAEHPDKNNKIISYHLLEQDGSSFARTEEFEEMPIHVARWRTDAGQVYGRGPGAIADPFARTLNQVVKTWIKQAQKSVDPPLLVSDDGVIQGPKTTPGSINFVTSYSPGSQEPIRPLDSGANFSVANAEIERLQMSIRKAYHHDILQITDSKELTAFHVQELTQRAQQWIAPVLQRIKVELVQPMVERSLRLAIENRLIASPPQSIIEKGLRTVYISPAQRANRIQEAEATMRALERIIALSQVYPEMLDNYDPDKIARTIHNDFAADPSILRTQRTVKEMRKQRQEEEEMAQQQEQMNQSMESSAPSGVTSIETAEALNQIRGAF